MLGNRLRCRLLHYILIGVGSAAVRFEPKVWLGGDVFGVYDGGRLFDGGHDGSEKQVDAGGGGNRVSDWQSRSQGASGGQGGVSGQKGAGETFQKSGRFKSAIREHCKQGQARHPTGERATVC